MELSLNENPAPTVKDVSTREFMAEVVEASVKQPVVVDFWAPWCTPCKQLGPVLEKAVTATAGRVKMVKVNMDENQQLAAQMGIQSIPAVFAFFKGQPVDGFMGNQPESTVRQWVERLAKLGGEGASPLAGAVMQAEALLEEGATAEARELFAEILQHDPKSAAAYAGLVKVALAEDRQEDAEHLLTEVPADFAEAKELAPLRAQLELKKQTAATGPLAELEAAVLANPEAHQQRYDLALALQAAGRSEEAIDQLVEIVRRDRKWNEEAARKQLLTLFEALGHNHELTVAGRRKLSSILFR